MPPKRKAGRPLYKEARDYFKAAYRARIKELHDDWTPAQIAGTLAWLWSHASDEEKQQSIDLRAARSHGLPTIDEATIPDEAKRGDDPAPVVPPAEAVEDEAGGETRSSSAVDGGGDDGRVDTGDAGGSATKRRVNTTNFPYLPDLTTLDGTLPIIEEIEPEDSQVETNAKKRRWLDAGLCYPEKEQDHMRWYGAHMLGKGSTGRVELWVGSNDMKVIHDRLAVRDVVVQRPERWISPVWWRDHLPREIAIQVRLNERQGYKHHIHRYYAHRINFRKRRYRVFNEICDLGNLLDALEWYSRLWRKRRHLHRWIYSQPDLRKAHNQLNDATGSPGTLEAGLARAKTKAWKRFLRQRKKVRGSNQDLFPDAVNTLRGSNEDLFADAVENLSDDDSLPNSKEYNPAEAFYHEYDAMSDLSEWHDDDLTNELPEVIPESFLWVVFDQLVDAFTVLGTGRVGHAKDGDDRDEEPWNEIVHHDLHIMNIFVKPTEDARGTPIESEAENAEYHFARFASNEAPSVVLADFDLAFFDLQSDDDVYADNPQQYFLGKTPLEFPGGGGRYPPEMYSEYEGHKNEDGSLERMTSKTDVWAIGQIMWNLVMNLPDKMGYLSQPFLHYIDHAARVARERRLVNGQPYDITAIKSLLFSGIAPYEASTRYSNTLKDTILQCFNYRQHERWSIAQLKSVTEQFAGREVPEDSNALGDVVIRIPQAMESLGLGERFNWPLDGDGNFKKHRISEDDLFGDLFGDSL